MGTSFFVQASIWFLYVMPVFIVVFFTGNINKYLLHKRLRVKTADLLVPFLVFGIYLFGSVGLGSSYFSYFLLFIFTFAIILVSILYYKVEKLSVSKFIYMWWRFLFLFSFPYFYIMGALYLLKKE